MRERPGVPDANLDGKASCTPRLCDPRSRNIRSLVISADGFFWGGGNEFAWASAKVIILSCFNMPRFEVQDVQGRPCGPAALAAF